MDNSEGGTIRVIFSHSVSLFEKSLVYSFLRWPLRVLIVVCINSSKLRGLIWACVMKTILTRFGLVWVERGFIWACVRIRAFVIGNNSNLIWACVGWQSLDLVLCEH